MTRLRRSLRLLGRETARPSVVLGALRRPLRFLGRETGQSSVELVALLPLVLILGVAILTLLAARAASGQASAAAQAGAMALIQDASPREAARDALPPDARRRATIHVDGRAITVTVRPHTTVGFLAGALSATATANAGPEPR
jgi:hypothetical protein